MLKRKIGLFGGVSVIIGTIIGSGIFISPKGVFENVPSVGWSLIIWTACGIISIIGALCYAELGTYIQESGGEYAYVFTAFGPLMGFLKAWLDCIIMSPCAFAINSLLCATYLLQPFYQNCKPPSLAIQLLAIVILLFLCFLNCVNVSLVTKVQKFLMVSKFMTLGSIILTGFYLLLTGKSPTNSFDAAFQVYGNFGDIDVGEVVLAFYAGFWAYGGWNSLNYLTEELVDPVKNLPRAILISLGVCTSIYLLVNISFFAGISPAELLSSNAVAFIFARKFYGWFAVVMPILVADSCFGSLNAGVLASSSYVNPFLHTPIPAVLTTISLSLLYIFMADNAQVLINYGQSVNWLSSGIVVSGLLYLRYKEPPSKYPRPLRINILLPLIFLVICIFLFAVPIIRSPFKVGVGVALALTGLPAHYFILNWFAKTAFVDKAMRRLTTLVSKVFLVRPAEKMVAADQGWYEE